MRSGVTNTKKVLTVVIRKDFHKGTLSREKQMINWIKNRMKERTSWDGAVCVALGLMILFMAPLD